MTMAVKREHSVRVAVARVFGQHPWDKDKALEIQERVLLPAVRAGKSVVLDFDGVELVSQSFAGTLMARLREELGPELPDWIEFENTNAVLDSVLSLAMNFGVRR